jgi:hypothetical protein
MFLAFLLLGPFILAVALVVLTVYGVVLVASVVAAALKIAFE